METNETILGRRVMSLDERKVLGAVSELRVDCDTRAVSHFIVRSASTNALIALPFDATLSVGDTFLMVQGRGEFLGANTPEERAAVHDGYGLVGVEAFSRTGNKLGEVRSYEFDPVFGTVERMLLDDGAALEAERFVFFAPDFVFVDDGSKTAAELRAQSQADAEVVPLVEEPVGEEEPQSSVADERPSEIDEEDAALIEFLVGKTLSDEVASVDGAFSLVKGTKLTRDAIDDARAHDALLLLAISVDA